MPLIVEDGTGLSTAESFVSVAATTTYHANRGNAAWAALASDTVREQYLRRATDYMQQVYVELWAGYRVTTAQALAWPRYDVPIKDAAGSTYPLGAYYASNAVPVVVANACAELALKASTQSLAPDVARQVKREKVDSIEVEYMDGASPFVRFRAIDLMLSPFMRGSAYSVAVSRA